MGRVRVTKMFDFEMAHVLWNYDGPCKNLHGHSYKLFVTVTGHPLMDHSDCKDGMVIDFGDLKKIVNETIVKEFDHAVIISSIVPKNFYSGMGVMLEKLHVVNYQPTCENMVVDFAKRIQRRLPRGLELFSLRLDETATSFAEWYSSDNL